MTKACVGKCKQIKVLSSFGKDKSQKDGLNVRCKSCNSELAKQWYKLNASKVKQRNELLPKTITLVAKRKAKFKQYGLSIEGYETLLKQQDFVCAICEKPESVKDKSGTLRELAVDHCHRTNIVRGLLCTRCNNLLGFAKDDLKILSQAQEYLTKSMKGI